jgi:hypothetical protein
LLQPLGKRRDAGLPCRILDAEGLGGFEIDYLLEAGRLLDGQFGRGGTLDDLVHVDRSALT